METALTTLLDGFRTAARSEREKGTYFEELIVCYLRNEPRFSDLYSDVWTYADWAKAHKHSAKDAGIDLVAKTADTNELHAVQCKLYDPSYTLKKDDIDSFFTASGKEHFARRIIVSTTNLWSEHAENALQGQRPPVMKIDLNDLENSLIDWSKGKLLAAAALRGFEDHGGSPWLHAQGPQGGLGGGAYAL